jgi:hypothetical protein
MSEGRSRRILPAIVLAASGVFLGMAPDAHARHPSSPAVRDPVTAHPPAPAEAPQTSPVKADVMVLHATNADDGGAGIDPRIGNLPALKQPPFSSYNTYKFISGTTLPVNKPATTTLPNGRVLQISLIKTLPNDRYRVAASINQPGGNTFLPLLEVTAPACKPFFVAGQSYQGGMLVVGITVHVAECDGKSGK